MTTTETATTATTATEATFCKRQQLANLFDTFLSSGMFGLYAEVSIEMFAEKKTRLC